MDKQVLIDGNSIGRQYNDSMKMSVGSMPTQAIFGVASTMKTLIQTNPDASFLWLWDAPNSNENRLKVYADYKKSRRKESASKEKNESRDTYNMQTPIIQSMLKLMGVKQMYARGHEADDIAGMLTNYYMQNYRVLLITGDSDWYQLIDKTVHCIDPRSGGSRVTLENFYETTGYITPDQYLEGKIMIGDSTDSIPAALKNTIGKETVVAFLTKYGSYQGFIDRVEAGEVEPKGVRMNKVASAEYRAGYERNKKLIDLKNANPIDPSEFVITDPALDLEKLTELFEKLSFLKFLNDPNFIKTFERKYVSS